jgi:hypothetical protein
MAALMGQRKDGKITGHMYLAHCLKAHGIDHVCMPKRLIYFVTHSLPSHTLLHVMLAMRLTLGNNE